MIFSPEERVSRLSRDMPLMPADVIARGTSLGSRPATCCRIPVQKPPARLSARWMQSGRSSPSATRRFGSATPCRRARNTRFPAAVSLSCSRTFSGTWRCGGASSTGRCRCHGLPRSPCRRRGAKGGSASGSSPTCQHHCDREGRRSRPRRCRSAGIDGGPPGKDPDQPVQSDDGFDERGSSTRLSDCRTPQRPCAGIAGSDPGRLRPRPRRKETGGALRHRLSCQRVSAQLLAFSPSWPPVSVSVPPSCWPSC